MRWPTGRNRSNDDRGLVTVGEAELTYARWFQEFQQTNFSGMDRREFSCSHSGFRVVVRDGAIIRSAIGSFEADAPFRIHANAGFALAIALEFFEAIAGRNA